MLDHHPPTLAQIKFFCHQVSKWLLQHPDNVAAVLVCVRESVYVCVCVRERERE